METNLVVNKSYNKVYKYSRLIKVNGIHLILFDKNGTWNWKNVSEDNFSENLLKSK